jgi:hypothetical protein
MIAVCLSVQGKGDLESIGVTYLPNPPFISVRKSSLNKHHKKLMNDYFELLRLMDEIPLNLSKLVPLLTEAADKCKNFPEEVSEHVERIGHTMLEKVTAIRYTSNNTQLVTSAAPSIQ